MEIRVYGDPVQITSVHISDDHLIAIIKLEEPRSPSVCLQGKAYN